MNVSSLERNQLLAAIQQSLAGKFQIEQYQQIKIPKIRMNIWIFQYVSERGLRDPKRGKRNEMKNQNKKYVSRPPNFIISSNSRYPVTPVPPSPSPQFGQLVLLFLNAKNIESNDSFYPKFFLNKGWILALWVMYTT